MGSIPAWCSFGFYFSIIRYQADKYTFFLLGNASYYSALFVCGTQNSIGGTGDILIYISLVLPNDLSSTYIPINKYSKKKAGVDKQPVNSQLDTTQGHD